MSPNAHKPWRPGPEILLAATLTLLLVVAQASDQWIFHHVVCAGMYERRWGQLLRMSGYLPLWGIVALALMLHDRVPQHGGTLREAGRRGLLLLWSAVLGGIVGEVLKIAFRRERPGVAYLMTLAVWRRRSPRSGVVTEGTG